MLCADQLSVDTQGSPEPRSIKIASNVVFAHGSFEAPIPFFDEQSFLSVASCVGPLLSSRHRALPIYIRLFSGAANRTT